MKQKKIIYVVYREDLNFPELEPWEIKRFETEAEAAEFCRATEDMFYLEEIVEQ